LTLSSAPTPPAAACSCAASSTWPPHRSWHGCWICCAETATAKITLDLSGLEFLCAAGLAVFLRADQALRAVGDRLVLTRPTCLVHRVLAIVGLDATLAIQLAQREGVSMAMHDSGEAP
jgi:anti-anti-sigma factor